MKRFLYALPFAAACLLILAATALLQACYTLSQGAALLRLLDAAVPLETLRETGDPRDARFAAEIDEIRRFAVEELGLKPTKNYTKYVALDRDYLAAIVSASEKDRFASYEWWFPVVGRVPYKGFFDRAGAQKEAEKLKKKDLDVLLRPVDAFSTLGWFNDPLYSFMKEYDTARLADLIIHESFHATLFLKNAVQFNEEIASFVGTEGARLYIGRRYGEASPEYAALAVEETERRSFIAFLQELCAELEEVYQSGLSRQEKLIQKEEVIAAAQRRFAREYDARFSTGRYRFFSEARVNNAYLQLYRLYHEEENRFYELYRASGADLPRFIAAAKTLNTKSPPLAQLEAKLLP
jgi:predicted aminopeptidase